MIERIIEYAIRNRYLVMLLAAGLTIFAIYAVLHTPMDAIPDLSENQVIVFTDWMGRSPQEIEDQVTYPLSLKLQGLAGVKEVRSTSEFNFSMITIIFEDKVGFYFARQRVLEKLALASTFLPKNVVPYLAPDATALGQVFWYTLEGGNLDPGRMWALQKFFVGPELNSVPGVAEVGLVGGFPKEYQIDVDPTALRAFGVTLGELHDAVARSNLSVGGRVIHKNNAEFLVRGLGWIENARDIENAVVKTQNGTPIYVRNVARVQLGTGFRRNIYEKDGNEVVGGVVVMRFGENPLAVIERVKHKIQELQPGLPDGVHIVPAYDRTRLIHGAIHTLTEVMWHEMVIAAVAILLILMHVRSVFVICVTLPLSVLFSFLLMWLLRALGIVDVQANIMSLAGITISIGILVDQAIVMVENATHHLKEKFSDAKVTGDTRDVVIRACRTVGRPIFFSVMIILISFIPVFALSGREGKMFFPMAMTKSLAMVGVAIISVTLVPALIPTFIRGRLRGEEQNWIVRSFINLYKPLLTWCLPARNFVMWMFSALLIVAVGFFPLQAFLGLGASHYYWEICFFIVMALVISITVIFTEGWRKQTLSFVSLVLLALWAYHVEPKIGVEYMPPLNEGTLMDMPVSVPRLSVTQAADDLKARDALLRSFPEVESVIGKAGRADTPTDPAPLEMVETFVNFRPRELWPKRALKYDDATRQVRRALAMLEAKGYLAPIASGEQRDNVVNDATMGALSQFDDAMRALALQRYREFENELGPKLVRFVVAQTVRRMRDAGNVPGLDDKAADAFIDEVAHEQTRTFARWLGKNPALEDVTRISQRVAGQLAERGLFRTWFALTDKSLQALRQDKVPADVLARLKKVKDKSYSTEAAYLAALEGALAPGDLPRFQGQLVKHGRARLDPAEALAVGANALHEVMEFLGASRRTFAGEVLRATQAEHLRLWREHVTHVNWELFDRGVEAFTWAALEEVGRAAQSRDVFGDAIYSPVYARLLDELGRGRNAKDFDADLLSKLLPLREELEKPFKDSVFFWRRTEGRQGDLQSEMDTVIQVPGWSNIWTQPIQNRIDMLATGVRTQVGVKVFGRDLDSINRAARDIETVLKDVPGARNVIAEQNTGEGYLVIKPDRERAARYGVNVGDIQDTIEVALGGRIITQTIEGRDRFPVRIRYARDFREDEEAVKRLLVSRSAMPPGNGAAMAMPSSPGQTSPKESPHMTASEHATLGTLHIPLGELADIRIVEGPSMIRSENGRLCRYVTLNVSGDRDIVGFVEEAQRAVAEKVELRDGVHVAWAGEFEHQVRAARTLRIIIPIVLILIFVILYLTYHDLMDALLMVMAVPEALAGAVFMLVLFPKIMHGWSTPPADFSVAVWVGLIAAFGMATETGIIMLVYLREAIDKRGGLENIKSLDELRQAVIEGAVHRLRPKLLTEGVAIVAIAPMLFSSGVGSEIIAAMALPVLGGLLIADEVVDIFLPVRFYWVRRARWLKLHAPKRPVYV